MPVRIKKTRSKKRTNNKKTVNNNNNVSSDIGFIGKALRGLGALSGSSLGAMVGQPSAGMNLGSSLGAALSRWLGAGDYQIRTNSIVSKASSSVPMMHKNDQTVVIRHKEFLCQVSGSTNFVVQREFTLNPGISSSFPWLSTIATRFQEYKIKGMVFHYIPTSGSYSSSGTALGSVMLQTTYRATDSAPGSKVEMLNEYWSNEVVPCESMAHPIECDPKENPFAIHYVRSGALVGTEPLLYDVGKTFLATSGMSTTGVVGDLWVTYEVELKKPMVASAVTSFPDGIIVTWTGPTMTTAGYFNLNPTTTEGSLPVTFSGSTVNLPVGLSGAYLMRFIASSSGGVSAGVIQWGNTGTPSAPTLVNCILTGGANNLITTRFIPATTGTAFTVVYGCMVYKADPSLPATVTLPVVGPVSGNFDLLIAEITEFRDA